MEKALKEANQKLEQTGEMEKSLIEANKKVQKLEAEIEESKAKNIGITEFKEPKAYKSNLTEIATLLLIKEKIKMERLLYRQHYIKDTSFLAYFGDKPTYSKAESDKIEEEGEEVT